MRKLKIILIISILLFTLEFQFNKVEAAGSITLTSNVSKVYIGDEFSVSVNLTGMSVATFTIKVSIDTNKIEYISGPGNSNFVNGRIIYTWTDPNGGGSPITSGTIATFKFKAKQTGNAAFSVNGDFYDSDENSITPAFSGTNVNIQEKIVTPPNNNENNNNNNSNNNSNPNGAGQTSGEEQTSQAGSNNQSQTGTNQSSTSNLTNNQNVNLRELHLSVEGLSPAFNKNTIQYYLVVSNLINDIDVNAIPENSSAKVEVTGNKNLKLGNNKIEIRVISQDGKKSKIYSINVSKTENKELGNANLENLAIENVTLIPEFNNEIFEYTAEVGSDIQNLNILAVPQRENARSYNRRK